VVLAPGPFDACDDVELVPADAVALLPAALERPGRTAFPQASWSAAAAAFLQARLRGHRFDRERRARLDGAARQTRRLAQLLRHLEDDLAGLPAPAGLRRQAEALLAAGHGREVRGGEIEVPDPYQPDSALRVRVDPRLTLPANADRLFEKARRLERARAQVESRLAQTRARLETARAAEASVRTARRRDELPGREDGAPRSGAPASAARESGPRHYLTSRGLSVLVGRGARENHHLTFTVARPEDVWLHARDVPGAHVIVRDPEGRAAPEDLREAAELAAFFSAAAPQGQVDVHVTRRKHVRPTRGGAGRVVVGHSETLRVAPRDPEGRLRRR
jgi:predicted ribosome quality control (RQC) complex YloA/Tae2 family protein